MDEEQAPIEEGPAAAPPEPATPAPERRNGRGPGLLMGLLAGALLGAIVVRLLAPKEGEQVVVPAKETIRTGDPAARIAAVLARVRGRMQEASHEAHEAAQEAEERLRGRYSQLTHQDGP